MIKIERSLLFLAKTALVVLLGSRAAHANLNDSVPTGNAGGGGYVETARAAASTAASAFNASDAAAGKTSVGVGVNVDAQTAISQFQNQYDAANKLVNGLNTALTGCLDAADAEIAAAQKELDAAAADAAACSENSGDDGNSSSDSGCASAAAARAAAAEAKMKQADANKKSCTSHISPMIDQGVKASRAVSEAATAAGFTMRASHGDSGGTTVVANKNSPPPTASVYVPPMKTVDTQSLDFWTTGAGAYPGASPGVDDLIRKMPGVNDTGPTVQVAASKSLYIFVDPSGQAVGNKFLTPAQADFEIRSYEIFGGNRVIPEADAWTLKGGK